MNSKGWWANMYVVIFKNNTQGYQRHCVVSDLPMKDWLQQQMAGSSGIIREYDNRAEMLDDITDWCAGRGLPAPSKRFSDVPF